MNPKYEELWRPVSGPQAPWTQSAIVPGQRNNLAGYVEDTKVNDYAFDLQHNTFVSHGIAINPEDNQIVLQRPKEKKRKRVEAEVLEGGEGAEKAEGEAAEKGDDESATKKQKTEPTPEAAKPGTEEELPVEEVSSELHIADVTDYLGRSWVEHPSHLKPQEGGSEHDECFLPKKRVHTFTGHSKGVSAIKFFPQYGHLLLSASMDCTVKVRTFFRLSPLRRFVLQQKSILQQTHCSPPRAYLFRFGKRVKKDVVFERTTDIRKR